MEIAADTLRFIFYPFGSKALEHLNQVLAIKMVKLMRWWLIAKPNEAPAKGLLELVRERRVVVMLRQSDGKYLPSRRDNPNRTHNLLHLIRLFKFSHCTGKEMNALIHLIAAAVNFMENNAADMRCCLIEPDNFQSLWRLYFDPLLIETVDSSDERARTNAIGQEAFVSQQPLTVRWSDGRQDVCSDGLVQPRERVDNLVHLALSACDTHERLLSLLSSIDLNFTRTVHIFPGWLRLYRHLMTLPHFDVAASEYVFGRLEEVNMDTCGVALAQFLFDVFDFWPLMTQTDVHKSVRPHLVHFIRVLINQQTHNSNVLVQQITERICAYSPANNVRGHLCFFDLLADVLPSYYEANLISAIKKIGTRTVMWYSDYVLESDVSSTSLLTIVKYVSMYTDDDLLCEWFHRMVNHPDTLLCFQLVEQSLCSTTTLATYVQHANEERGKQLITCIHTDTATQFMSIFATILDCLAKKAQTHRYLFGSDLLFRVIQRWLAVATVPSTTVRLVQLLLDIGYSKCNPHAHEIAQFFLQEYSSTFIDTDFAGNSPLADITRFLLAEMEIDATNLCPEILVEKLFRSLEKTNDDDSSTHTSHLLSLTSEIVQPRSREKLAQLLSPFTPDIMGLLGRTGQLKKSGIVLLAEILNLSPNERLALAENVQDPVTVNDSAELSTANLRQPTSFFSSGVTATTNTMAVASSDFTDGHRFLDTLKKADSDKVDQLLRSHVRQQRTDIRPSNDEDLKKNRLVLTATARENVSKLLEVLDDPIAILLEGSTGVGKSASVMEAAQQVGRKLVRHNMSSRVNIDDLLGKVSLVPDPETQTTRLQFQGGPFTAAFTSGAWLLLDELNLAQDTVLQAIESALDTRQLVVSNSSSAEQPILFYRMHADFRLFATQNPNTGYFKGKREKLSPSFLSRFRPLVFKELPDQEWKEIVQRQLAIDLPDEAEPLAEQLVLNFNANLRKAMSDTQQTSVEMGPYAETSIRELLKWVRLLGAQKNKGLWPRQANERAALLSFSAWCVYGARYRGEGRAMVERILTDDGIRGWGRPSLQNIGLTIDLEKNGMHFDTVRFPVRVKTSIEDPEAEWKAIFAAANLPTIPYDRDVLTRALEVHNAIHKAVLNIDFILSHGIYRINRSWLWEWLVSAARSNLLMTPKALALHGSQMYQSRFRHGKAQQMVRHSFSKVFNDSHLKEKIANDSFVRPEMPYVLTDRVLSTFKQVCFNMSIKQPILLTGDEGCGKSELLLTLAWFTDQRVHQLNITPETEPSALIGQLVPNDSKDESDPNYGQKLIWQDGCVTLAYTRGHWVLLDNLNVAESSVLERLNPVLEQKPMLILTEHGHVDEQTMHNDYQLVATMTPPDARSQSQGGSADSGSELSPALYNRFGVIHMPDISFESKQNDEELLQIAKVLLSDEPNADHELAVIVCRAIFDFYQNHTRSFPKLTMRNIIRLLDSTHLLRLRFKTTLDFASSLWTAYHVTIANQIKDEAIKKEMTDHLQKKLTEKQPDIPLQQPTFTDWIRESKEHILTPSRLEYANAVLGAVACNIPLLLEGPAAVGKTALISFLCKHFKTNSGGIQLERVNNTDTTTIQDYLGTFLPVNDGFVFQKGALYRAMENGWWFLADEFNLADPSVMNVLFPLLEGKNAITIPSSGKVITAKTGFQFFATQNDASYANRYRLPVSLRNRFLEVQFGEFPTDELPTIILERNEPGKLKPNCLTKTSAKQLAQFYHRVLRTRSRITFRELVKWLHRHALLSPEKELWPTIGASLLTTRYPNKSDIRETLVNDLKMTWPSITMPLNPQVEIKEIGGKVRFREGDLYVDMSNMSVTDPFIQSSPDTFVRAFIRLALAVAAKEPVLLVGPTSCKTLLIETWTRLCNRTNELIKVHLTPDTEAGDLIGEIQPYSMLDLLKRLPAMAERVYLRFRSLCRHHNGTGVLTIREESFLQPLVKAINVTLPEAIRQFELAYSREEERRQQTDDLYDDFTAVRATAEAMMMPSMDQPRPSTTSDEPVSPISQPVVQSSFPSYYEGNAHYDLSYQPDDALNFTGETYVKFDDGFGGSGSADLTAYPTYLTEAFDDGFEMPTTTNETAETVMHDGFEMPTSTQQPTTTMNEPVETVMDDGFAMPTDAPPPPTTTTTDEAVIEDGFPSIIPLIRPVHAKATTLLPPANSTDALHFPDDLVNTILDIRSNFKEMLQHTSYASFAAKDVTLLDYQTKFDDFWNRLNAPNLDRSKPIFLFNDGPVTVAAKRGGILFLEDLDLPSQAVIERLNSMLEPSPTFALTEDITSQGEKGQLDIVLSNQFQVFASVHQEQAHQLLKLSPATRSRFTEIYVPPYSEEELRSLIQIELTKHEVSASQIEPLVGLMFSVRATLHNETEWKVKNDIQLLFRWTDFLVNHHHSISLDHRMFLGARFFFFDQLPMQKHEHLFDQWLKNAQLTTDYEQYRHLFQPPNGKHGAITLESLQSVDANTPRLLPFDVDRDFISLKYTDVCYTCEKTEDQSPAQPFDELRKRFYCVPTPTLINQIARIFAAASSKTPLLLEGPPGIGKTQVVTQVCALLNKECERINMSANTSLDQLIGCVIPRFVNGVRVFQWQEGRVIAAIKARKWILFDELNLAAPEVLEGLTPLFYRGMRHFTVPSTGEMVELGNVRLFATMNPSTIGGGRTKLPRSISNLFTIVQLDDYSEGELRIILNSLFQPELSKETISMPQLDTLFDLHMSLKDLVREGTIGRTGGPYELNLRDLSKFRDVFRGSIDSQLFHYQYMSTTDEEDEAKQGREETSNTLSPTMGASDSRFLSIRKFAQVAYACQFHGHDDFVKACEEINAKFPINGTLSKRENEASIDTSVATVVRIGSIYINTGNEEPNSATATLIHTEKTVRQLELLAVACQSKRAILLEGDICSRKSSLVIELARLTRQRLVIIPMHENFETSDLIGSWRPTANSTQRHPLFDKIETIFKQVVKVLLLVILPLQSKDENNDVFSKFKGILRKRLPIAGADQYEMVPYEIEALTELVALLNRLIQIAQLGNEGKVLISCYARQADYYATKLKSVRGDNQQEMSFAFVEAEFVQAIREGWWVLLDNINSAPPEVLERLNSLTEDNPMLSLYENSHGQVLTQRNGIHSNFRLFTTANLNRIYSNKLSSAFLNRVIRIWLPPIDECQLGSDSKITQSDLYELLVAQLSSIAAGKQLAHLLIVIHVDVKQQVKDGQLTYPSDFLITYRLLEQCVRTLCYLLNKGINPVPACFWALLRSYCSSLRDIAEFRSFIAHLQETIDRLELRSTSTVFSTATNRVDTKQPSYLQEAHRMCGQFIQFERFLIELQFTVLQLLADDVVSRKATRDLFVLFIDEILLPQTPADPLIIQSKQTLLGVEDEARLDLHPMLAELLTVKQLTTRFDRTPSLDLSTFVQDFLQNDSRSFQILSDQLNNALDTFIRNTSFNDTAERLAFLQRAVSIVDTFQRFFSSSLFSMFDQRTNLTSLCAQLTQHLRPLLTFKEKCKAYELFQDAAFVEAKNEFRLHLFNHFDTGLIWSFERAQTFPIRSARKDLRKLIQHVVNNQTDRQVLQRLEHFATLQEWIGLQWTFEDYLTSTVHDALQKNISITLDFVLDCELKFCAWELSKQISTLIDETVRHLPSKSTPINSEYIQLKEEIDKIKNEIKEHEETIEQIEARNETVPTATSEKARGRLRRQHSAFNSGDDDPASRLSALKEKVDGLRDEFTTVQSKYAKTEHIRSQMLEEALNSCLKLQQETRKILASAAYDFVRQRFEQPDAQQLNGLYRSLDEARQNPTLTNTEGVLDFRAVLATPFGRTLIEHDDVVQSPLIFILCNFFVAPRLYDQHRLHFISSWQQFTTDFDIRMLTSADLFFFCPSKQANECSLVTVENSARRVSLILWSLGQCIDTTDLDELLGDHLPSGVEYVNEHRRLSDLARTLTNDGHATFGLACLLHLHEASGSSTSTINELYKQLVFIVEQFKQFVQHKASERKSLPMLIYQQLNRFDSELQGLNMKDYSSDPWLIAVEQIWKLIGSYRNIFSSTTTQNIDEQLRYTILSVRPANLSSRITSLALLKGLTAQYSCTHLLINHLTDGGTLTNAEHVKDFELFFQFNSRITRLIKLITQHVLFCGEQLAGQFYQCTPTIISHLESLFRSTLSVTEIVDEKLHVAVKQSPITLKEFQNQLNQIFVELHLPNGLLSRYNLFDIVTHVAPLYDEHRVTSLVNSSSTTSLTTTISSHSISTDPREIRRRTMRSKIEETIVKVTGLLSRANQLSIRPHLIIQRIHSTLHRLKNFDISQESENNYQVLLNEEHILDDLLHKFTREINQHTAFSLVLPADHPIHQLTDKELQLDPAETAASNHQDECKAVSTRFHQISQGKESTALNQIIRLTHAQVSDQTWIEAMSLLVPDKRKELKTILMSLNDELAMQIEQTEDNGTGDELLIMNIVAAYAQFRYDLLRQETERDMLSSYVPVARLSRELREWTTNTNLNVFNMLETVQKLKNDLSLAQNQMKNFTGKASCHLLPVDLRPEDLICLFAPEQTSTIRTIFAKYQELDTFLACRTDDIQPMQLPSLSPSHTGKHGLATFAYRRESTVVPLFDNQRHIHSTLDTTSTFIQQLVNVCIEPKTREGVLMNTCTSVKELFPVQMALSMALLVLIESVGGHLYDFKHQIRLLMMTTLKIEVDEIRQLDLNLQELEQTLRETKKEVNKIAGNLSRARDGLNVAMNKGYVLIEKEQESVSQWTTRDKDIRQTLDKQRKEIDLVKKDLQSSKEKYQMRLEQEQENWLNTLFEYFQKLSHHIRPFVGTLSAAPASSEPSINDLLAIIVDVTRRQLLNTNALILDSNQIDGLEKTINDILAEIHDHLMKLSDSDQVRSFVLFYCQIIRMALSSLVNGLISWKEYSKTLRTSQMKFYAETAKKRNLATLNLWTNERCTLFLQEIRRGAEQTAVIALAQQIKQRVFKDILLLETSLTGHDAQHMQHLIREFERFVINLLIVGCRFVQLQRGINEPLDELLADVPIDDLDLHVSRSELELLQLLEAREMQLHSQNSTLLFLTLHLAFDFNSNPFGLFDQLDQSIQALIRLLVPSAYMIKRTWLTIDELIDKTEKNITGDELSRVQELANAFESLTDPSNSMTNFTRFLTGLFEGASLSSVSEQIDRLCDTFLLHRSSLRIFCEQLVLRWHSTLKEIFRAFIQSLKYYTHRQLEWNQRKMKNFTDALTNDSDHEGKLFLADIERMLKRKNLVLATVDSEKKATLLKRFYFLEVIYHLTLGGIDNLEIILMNKPIEQMDFALIKQLFVSTKNLYATSEDILLKKSFHDFVHGERAVNQAFQVIEDLYRQESKILDSFYQLCKQQTIDHYEQLTHYSDFRELLEQSRKANEQWQMAGENFVILRREKRKSDQSFFRTIGHGLMSLGRAMGSVLPLSFNATESDEAVNNTLNGILLDMQSLQLGNEQIFTMPPQEELVQLIQLHRKYKTSLNLRDLDEHGFSQTDKVFRFEIERYPSHTINITIHFWRANEKEPFHTLPVPLTERITQRYVVMTASITKVAVETEHLGGTRVKWSHVTEKKKHYILKNHLILRCEKVSRKYFHTTRGFQDTLSPEKVPSLFEIRQSLDNLDKYLHMQLTHSKETDLFRQSPMTTSFTRLIRTIYDIGEMIHASTIEPEALSNTSRIYALFQKLSSSNVHNRAIDLLRKATFPEVPSTTQFVDDTVAATETKFDQVWTRSMNAAFQLNRKCLEEAKTQLILCHNYARQVKAHLILAYAWANALSLHPSSNTQQEFATMLTDYQQMEKLSNEESICCRNTCQRIVVDAQRIYRTIKRTSHNWNDIKHLLKFTSFPSEENVNEAFSRSQMSRDAHLWITETTDGLSHLQCHPRPAVLDFGITLSTIPQRLFQRIFLHNQSDRDLNVQLDRPPNAHELLSVSAETIQLASGDTHELQVLLKSPTTVDEILEKWHLKIDGQPTLADVLQVQVKTVEVDMKLSAATIDFGLIPCESHRLERSVQLENVLPCAVRVKTQLQTPETNRWQSNLTLLNNELEIPAESSLPFNVTLETSENVEEDLEANICLAINTPKNIKWLKVLGKVRRTRLLVSYQGRPIMDNVKSGHLSLSNFCKGEKRRLSFEFRNDGQVEYALRLQSSTLKLFVGNVTMSANETKNVEVEADMANETRRDFVLHIEFLNCKRRCQLTLVCATSYAYVTYLTRPVDQKQIVTIDQAAHMGQLWDADRLSLKSIEHEITFKNTGQAAGIVHFDQIIARNSSTKLSADHFRVVPNDFVVSPYSHCQ